MFARHARKPGQRNLAALAACTLALSALVLQGGMQSAQADDFNKYVDAPIGKASLPLADDIILNYAQGKPVASAYKFSYICPTNPDDDLNPPYDAGNGVPQSKDFTEYQSQPCYFGTSENSKVLDLEEIDAAFGGVRELYGLAPWFESVPTVVGQLRNLYGANTPISDIQANCPRQGPPVTAYTDPVGTCAMHMNVLHFPADNGKGDINYHIPGQAPLPAHSHILGDFVTKNIGKTSIKESPTTLGPTWWHPRSVLVLDRSIWPDAAGNCPAGRDKCLTTIKALREAQKNGQARTEGGSNILLYFSVQEIDQAGISTLNSFSTHDSYGALRPEGLAKWKAMQQANFGNKATLDRVKDITREVKATSKAEKLAAAKAAARKDSVTAPAHAGAHSR